MTDSRDGQVVTFYSYKGGTGRTMALANAAWTNGKRCWRATGISSRRACSGFEIAALVDECHLGIPTADQFFGVRTHPSDRLGCRAGVRVARHPVRQGRHDP